MENLLEILKNNPYPGRGIALGKTPGGGSMLAVYFIMGRSENSRNRVFVTDGEGIKTQAHDPAKLTDPSLIIYSPVRVFEGRTIVTNGDQTDTIYDSLKSGGCFAMALRTREFEPDAPNYTPRISGILEPDGNYRLSILKSAGGDPSCCERQFFEYEKPIAGQGHFISTYEQDGTPLPSFRGEPIVIKTSDDWKDFAQKVWESLNPDNRVSLFVRRIPINGGEAETMIFNARLGE